jgi:ABC-type maltose transport system permease subunit
LTIGSVGIVGIGESIKNIIYVYSTGIVDFNRYIIRISTKYIDSIFPTESGMSIGGVGFFDGLASAKLRGGWGYPQRYRPLSP